MECICRDLGRHIGFQQERYSPGYYDQRVPSFIALPLLTKPAEPVEREIKVEVRKGGLVMTVSWPMSAASEFACWSACVLK